MVLATRTQPDTTGGTRYSVCFSYLFMVRLFQVLFKFFSPFSLYFSLVRTFYSSLLWIYIYIFPFKCRETQERGYLDMCKTRELKRERAQLATWQHGSSRSAMLCANNVMVTIGERRWAFRRAPPETANLPKKEKR